MAQVSDLNEVTWDAVTDVIVVGGGAAAMSAAAGVVLGGGDVIVLERGELLGGTTAKSHGAMWVPCNSYQADWGFTDSHQSAVAYIARVAHPRRFRLDEPRFGLTPNQFDLIDTYVERGGAVIDELVDAGALSIRQTRPNGEPLVANPDYQAHFPENDGIRGRTLIPGWPPDEPLPDDLDESATGGTIMVERMRQTIESGSGEVRLGHRVDDVIVDDSGRAVGVIVHIGHRTELIGARRGIVFGTGGFLMNHHHRDEFLRGPVFGGCAATTNDGDFVDIASRLGVAWSNMTHAWWDQVVLEVALLSKSTAEDVFMTFGDSMIQVNKYGDRVVNEKQVYNERSQAHFWWDPSRQEYSNMLLFQIWDEAVATNPLQTHFRGYVPYPGEQASYVLRGDTFEELAMAIDARLVELASDVGGFRLAPSFAENLGSTIERFNEFAKSGVDVDFHRGESPIQQAWQVPQRPESPNPTMAPFGESGPYYAMILAAGALDTKGGPEINSSGQVLSPDGTPIVGLYGAGNCVGSPMGQGYPGSGGSIGPAVVFGYLAGQHAAGNEPVAGLA